MRLGIDARLYNQTGVGVYIRNLLWFYKDFIPADWEVYLYVYKDLPRFRLPKNWRLRKVDAPWHSLKEQTLFLGKLLSDNLDLMHFTYFSFPILYNKKFVITIHDLIPLKFKTGKASTRGRIVYELKHFFYKMDIYSAFRNAKKIIVPTKVVRQEMIKLGAKAERVEVVFMGLNEEIRKIKTQKLPVKKPYLLYVGNFYPHKNVEFLIKAFLKQEKIPFLYFVGPEDIFAKKIKEKYSDLLDKRFFFLHSLPAENLAFVYKNAKALVQPSLAEGFGLTLLEAFYFGCPVLASKIKVFEEVYSDLPIYFDPKSVSSFLAALKELDEFRLDKKSVEGMLAKYSFSKVAKATLQIYKSI